MPGWGKPFEKGQSGNPRGRPKVVAEVRELAPRHTALAVGALVQIVGDDEQDPRARVAAARELLDRGYGRPHQDLAVDTTLRWAGEDIVAIHTAAPPAATAAAAAAAAAAGVTDQGKA